MEIRDQRKPGWFWADRDIIKRDGATLGPYGIAVYVALCSFAGQGQEAWPSLSTLAEMIGCSRRHVIRKLKQLEEMGWIAIEGRTREDGAPTSNVYRLLCNPQPEAQDVVEVVTASHHPSDTQSPKRKSMNDTLEDTNVSSSDGLSEGLSYCLERFSRKRFTNKGQREALAKCETEVGLEVFKQAVDWRANIGGLNANSLISAAHTIAKGGNGNGRDRAGPKSARTQAPRTPETQWQRQFREHTERIQAENHRRIEAARQRMEQ